MSKLPSSLIDNISALRGDWSPVAEPYVELQNILSQSYRLSAAQKTARLLDRPGQLSNKPSVLMDQLIALRLDSLDDIMQVLFFWNAWLHPGCG